MQVEYISKRCSRCGCIRDHTLLKYVDKAIAVCMQCQCEETVKEIEEIMKRTYTVLKINEEGIGKSKHKVIATLECKTEPETCFDSSRRREAKVEIIKVTYPAWHGKHYTGLIEPYPAGGVINFVKAREITTALNEVVRKEKE